MALIHHAAEDQIVQTPEDVAKLREAMRESYAMLDSVMTYIAGGSCNLGNLVLTDSQQEYLKFVFDQFAKGEEVAAINVAPTVVSML